MKARGLLFAVCCILLAGGCATVDIGSYAKAKPTLDLATYFNGTVDGWGMFQDRSGNVLRRFYVRIEGKWDGNNGVLDEAFEYADGTRENRVWKLVRDGDRYTGTAGDVIGTAQGMARGNALQWAYVLAVPVDGKTWNMDMDDWMYLIDEKTLMNRTAMSKFGVRVGDVTLTFRKR